MGDIIEAIFTADTNGNQWTCSAWDPRTGTNVMVYKGGGATPRNSLALLRHEFLISANSTKPMLHIWPLNSQDQVGGARFITPGKVSTLDISPDGNYLIAGIQETIHIWHMCSGKMLNALAKHYQCVTKIKFTDDGTHFVSAGQDGNILVWNLTKAVSMKQSEVVPLYTFNDHGLSVTDFHIGTGGIRALLYTVSIDRTCRVYDLSTGEILLNLVFPDALQCIVVNKLETFVYVGSAEGRIYEFSLVSPPRSKEYHITSEDSKNSFDGHKDGGVSCLSLSVDGQLMMSGGADNNINIWHIPSRQLLRSIPHKGPISNAFFTCITHKLKEPQDTKHRSNFVVTNNLKRMMDTEDDDYAIETMVTAPIETEETSAVRQSVRSVALDTPSDSSSEIEKLRAKISELQKVNKELFIYCTKNALNGN